jgi:hypothetical protein
MLNLYVTAWLSSRLYLTHIGYMYITTNTLVGLILILRDTYYANTSPAASCLCHHSSIFLILFHIFFCYEEIDAFFRSFIHRM